MNAFDKSPFSTNSSSKIEVNNLRRERGNIESKLTPRFEITQVQEKTRIPIECDSRTLQIIEYINARWRELVYAPKRADNMYEAGQLVVFSGHDCISIWDIYFHS